MKIVTQTFQNEDPFLAALSGVAWIDIETTGLSPERDRVWLIGCAYHGPGGWTLTQWFDDSGQEEKEVISSFLLFISRKKTLIHYNGDRFDLPFLRRRISVCGISDPLGGFGSLDLMKELKPYKALLGLPDLRQQTVESFIGTGRTEAMSGAETAKLYKAYLAQPSEETCNALLAHNEADIRGLISLTPVLSFHDLTDAHLDVYKAQADTYADHSGASRQEVVLYFHSDKAVPIRINSSRDGCYLRLEGTEGLIKVPIVHEELRYFYAGYRDYYYLPEQDTALHKSIAAFVDSSHRVQATAETCYTRKYSSYLPEWDAFRTPFYKRSYRDSELFFELTDELKRDRAFFSRYAEYIYRRIVTQG